MPFTRRTFGKSVLAALIAKTGITALPANANDGDVPLHDMSAMPEEWFGNEQIAMLLYPGFTALDLIGPQYAFSSLMGATVHLVAASREPIMSDTKLAIVPTTTFSECPKKLDILFVPGGSTGTLNAMRDKTFMDFVADAASRADYVTSVCTGSLILGHAGLLKGYSATSHWGARELLTLFGASPVNKRYVIDRNRITGAGVTAGFDFGLVMTEIRRGRAYAEGVQLLAEYDPQPPFSSGTPEKAAPGTTAMMKDMFVEFNKEVRSIAGVKN